MGIHNPTIARQMTGSMGMGSSPLAKQNTGGLSADSIPWEITPEEKTKFDRFFDQLDVNGDGLVEGTSSQRFSVALPYQVEDTVDINVRSLILFIELK